MTGLELIPARIPGNSGVGVRLLMGDGPAQLTQGYGGMWETVGRSRRKAITRFTGADPIGQDIPIMLDGFAQDRSVQSSLDQLLSQLQPVAATWDPNFHPPVWRLDGPVHYPWSKKWIVADIEFGDAIRNDRGDLIRQAATLKLLEYVQPDSLRIHRKPLTIKPRKVKAGKKITVKGLTLRQIAVKYYGTAKVAKPLGKAQKPPVRDVRKKLHRTVKLIRVTIP